MMATTRPQAPQPRTPAVEAALEAYAHDCERQGAAGRFVEGLKQQAAEHLRRGDFEAAAMAAVKAQALGPMIVGPALTPGSYQEARDGILRLLNEHQREVEQWIPSANHMPALSLRGQLMRMRVNNGTWDATRGLSQPLTSDEQIAERAQVDLMNRNAQIVKDIRGLAQSGVGLDVFVQNAEEIEQRIRGIEADLPRAWHWVERARAVRYPGGAGDAITSTLWTWHGDAVEGRWESVRYPVPQRFSSVPPSDFDPNAPAYAQ